MVFVRWGRSHTYLSFELILEQDSFIVVVVGKNLESRQTGEVAFTTLVPVVRKVVLADLQRSVTTGHPPVGTADLYIGLTYIIIHVLRLEQVDNTGFRGYFRFHVATENITAHDAVFRSDYQLWFLQIKIHQCLIDQSIGTSGLGECQRVIRKKLRWQLRSGIQLHRLPFQF